MFKENMPKEVGYLQHHINDDVQKDLNALYEHAKIANQEMGDVKIHLSNVAKDVEYLKAAISSINKKQWAIILLIISAAIAVLFKH